MAEKSLFYNAKVDTSSVTGYDRNYNADDISDWLAFILTTGVLKTETALKVTPAGGMTINVDTGRAVILGKGYINKSIKEFTVPTAPTGSTPRTDAVILQMNKTDAIRETRLIYRQGTSSAVPTIDRSEAIYELILATITVAPNVTSITAQAITDRRGDNESVITITGGTGVGYCPWLVAAKGYPEYYDAIVLEYTDKITVSGAATDVITFDIPQYGWTGVDILNVYTNGIKESRDAYTVSGNTITFTGAGDPKKTVGTVVEVVVEKFIDGEGLGTVLEQYNELAAEVLKLSNTNEYKYVCNGVDDNIKLSAIAQAWLDGGEDYGSKKITVFGTFGCSEPAGGNGTASNFYQWLKVGGATAKNRRIVFDFSACGQLSIPVKAGAFNAIFGGVNAHIIGANVLASQTAEETVIRVFSSAAGAVIAENCRFWITSYRDSVIANTGTFTNCRGSVANLTNNSYCFLPFDGGLLRVNGGEYYAYTGNMSNSSAIVGQSAANAVSVLYAVSAPTSARSGFYQTNSVLQWTGGGLLSCTDLISELPMTVVAGISNIRGTLAKSKGGLL